MTQVINNEYKIKYMVSSNPITIMLYTWFYLILCTLTSIVGYNIHQDLLWAIFDFWIAPLIWVKWLILKEVNITLITNSFNWFFL